MAQQTQDAELFRQTQEEMMAAMKDMMKNQMLPMCLRSLLFLGIFFVLGLIYGEYTEILPFNILFFGRGWVALYLVTSLGLSLVIFLLKKLFGKKEPETRSVKEMLGMSESDSLSFDQKPVGTQNTFSGSTSTQNNWKSQLSGPRPYSKDSGHSNKPQGSLSREKDWKNNI